MEKTIRASMPDCGRCSCHPERRTPTTCGDMFAADRSNVGNVADPDLEDHHGCPSRFTTASRSIAGHGCSRRL
jgi:hypothetical protein